MPTNIPPDDLRERLSSWRRVVAQAQDAKRYRQLPAEETAVLAVLAILLWLLILD